jgi:hypothetical protein
LNSKTFGKKIPRSGVTGGMTGSLLEWGNPLLIVEREEVGSDDND